MEAPMAAQFVFGNKNSVRIVDDRGTSVVVNKENVAYMEQHGEKVTLHLAYEGEIIELIYSEAERATLAMKELYFRL